MTSFPFFFLSGSKGANKLQAYRLSSKRLLADSPEKGALSVQNSCKFPHDLITHKKLKKSVGFQPQDEQELVKFPEAMNF